MRSFTEPARLDLLGLSYGGTQLKGLERFCHFSLFYDANETRNPKLKRLMEIVNVYNRRAVNTSANTADVLDAHPNSDDLFDTFMDAKGVLDQRKPPDLRSS